MRRQPADPIKAGDSYLQNSTEVDLQGQAYANTATAQRRHLAFAVASAVRGAGFTGAGWSDPATRGGDGVRHRWRLHEVDVLGRRVSHSAAPVDLVFFVRNQYAFARRRN